MTHRHFCDFDGHYWDCDGMATRLLAPQPSVCICMDHGVPMEEGDHSKCSVELLACPEHHDEQMRAMGYEPGYTEEPPAPGEESSPMFQDEAGNHIVGFCLWCNKNFYGMEEHEAHTADGMANCLAFQELKDEDCGPPVLFKMFQQAGLLDDATTERESQDSSAPEEEE